MLPNKYIKIIVTSIILAFWILIFYYGLSTGLNFVLSLLGIIILFALLILNGILVSRAESRIVSFIILMILGVVAPALYIMTSSGHL